MGLEGAQESCNWYVPGLSWGTVLSTHTFMLDVGKYLGGRVLV